MFGVFTPFLGGALIGLSASLLLLSHGKVAGISGIVGGALRGDGVIWRAPFLIGLFISAPLMSLFLSPELQREMFANSTGHSALMIAIAGLLVGVGTRLGNGCTSGHGVCGLARASKRSFAATMTFMGTGVLAVYLTQHVL